MERKNWLRLRIPIVALPCRPGAINAEVVSGLAASMVQHTEGRIRNER